MIGQEGSGVKITSLQWETAISRASFTEMALSLVRAVFPLETLLISNLSGRKSKIDPYDNQRPGLDKTKIAAIRCNLFFIYIFCIIYIFMIRSVW